MKSLLLMAAMLALAVARPETYKETEDFQYARSSTDEGSKSGFYGAQRGNMGGNYERAHNMDGLAQHQLSTAVKQVEGELGDASKMKSGNVFTSANSAGMFGSGHYDLSNLQGRNFQENYAAANSQSHSSLSSHQSAYNDQLSSSMHNSGYNNLAQNSGYRGYHGTKNSGQTLQSSNLQAAENVHDSDYNYGSHGASHSSGYASQSGYNAHTAYDSTNSNANQYASHSGYVANPQNRLIYATPVKIVGRPGSRVAIPVGVQTYDASHSASTVDHSASSFDHSSKVDDSASVVDQNAINSEAEILNTDDHHVTYRPAGIPKRYESSYSYRKQWEKHDVKPEVIALSVPTENPISPNSELYDDRHTASNQYASGLNSQSGYSSNLRSGYNSNVKSSSAAQTHMSAADSHQSASSDSNAYNYNRGTYNSGVSADSTNALGDIDSKPKSYHSSYSYRKAWERQGDPYEIKPVPDANLDLESQRLTSATNRQGYTSHRGGSNYHNSHQSYTKGGALENCDCDEYGNVRVARSLRGDQPQEDLNTQVDQEDMGQQVQQHKWDNMEYVGQEQKRNGWTRIEDINTQSRRHHQNQLQEEDLTQEVQQNKLENLEDLGQQTQQIRWDNTDQNQQAHSKRTY